MPRPNVSEQRKQEILQAAAGVFTQQGLSIARMEDVAAAANISKGTIYLYYPSKEKLIEALLNQIFQPLDQALERLITSQAAIHQRLSDYAQETLVSFEAARPIHPLVLELFALARRQAFAGQLFGGYFSRYRQVLSEILHAAAERGELSLAAFDHDVQQAALSFIATVEGVLILTLITPSELDLQTDGSAILRTWLNQLR